MSTAWNKLDEWKKKVLIGLTLISAVNISAQRPTQYQEVPADQIGAALAQRSRRSNPVVYDHPAYANRDAYRQTGRDIVEIDGYRCQYDTYYSSGIDPYAEYNGKSLTGVYSKLNQYNEPIDSYVLAYQHPNGVYEFHHVSGQNLRDQFEAGNGGFLRHPKFNNGHYGPGYGYGPHHHHSRAGSRARKAFHGAVEMVDGALRFIDAVKNR